MISEPQKRLVQESWAKLEPTAETVAGLFYNRLFDLDPSLRGLFAHDMDRQGIKFTQTMTVVVKGLLHVEALIPAVRELGRRHQTYGVRGEHYRTVGDALLWTLEKRLGDAFTPAVNDAWMATYAHLADTMRSAAEPPPQMSAA
jgi:hemoglobin-like flavoprotein